MKRAVVEPSPLHTFSQLHPTATHPNGLFWTVGCRARRFAILRASSTRPWLCNPLTTVHVGSEKKAVGLSRWNPELLLIPSTSNAQWSNWWTFLGPESIWGCEQRQLRRPQCGVEELHASRMKECTDQ